MPQSHIKTPCLCLVLHGRNAPSKFYKGYEETTAVYMLYPKKFLMFFHKNQEIPFEKQSEPIPFQRGNKSVSLFLCDNQSHTTVSDILFAKPIDEKRFTQLTHIAQQSFYDALMSKLKKIKLTEMFTFMFAGYGLFRFLEMVVFSIFG